jgi:hypothetical protein
MRRSIPWGLIAFLPIAFALVLAFTPDSPSGAPAFLPQTPLIVEYWFLVFGGLALLQMLFFAVHAWRNPKVGHNRRLFWVVAILFFAVVSTPLYWWAYAEPAT